MQLVGSVWHSEPGAGAALKHMKSMRGIDGVWEQGGEDRAAQTLDDSRCSEAGKALWRALLS